MARTICAWSTCRDRRLAQARRCFSIVRAALEEAHASLRDVVRTRVLLVYIEDWPAVAAVHGEILGDVRPACTVMQVARFIDPGWLVELEVDAMVADAKS